jgi:DNA-binding MarR family transcriptional regulator
MLDQSIATELHAIFKQLIKRMAEECRTTYNGKLTLSQYQMLELLKVTGPMKTMELAQSLCVTSAAVTGMADKLIEMNTLERRRDDEDRRVVYHSITDEGLHLVNKLVELNTNITAKFFANLSEEDVGHMRRIFNNVLQEVDQ